MTNIFSHKIGQIEYILAAFSVNCPFLPLPPPPQVKKRETHLGLDWNYRTIGHCRTTLEEWGSWFYKHCSTRLCELLPEGITTPRHQTSPEFEYVRPTDSFGWIDMVSAADPQNSDGWLLQPTTPRHTRTNKLQTAKRDRTWWLLSLCRARSELRLDCLRRCRLFAFARIANAAAAREVVSRNRSSPHADHPYPPPPPPIR